MQLTKYSFCAVMLLILNLNGCSYLKKFIKPKNGDISLDSTLIQNYGQTLELREKLKAPFIASYAEGEKNLVYVAALHTDGAGNTTHQTIEKAFQEFFPNFLIVEGSAFTIISDPDDIAYAKKCEKHKFENCGEDAFAITQALKHKIPFCYGEPSYAAIHATLTKRFVTDEELIAYYALKEIPNWKRADLKANHELNMSWKKKFGEALVRASKKFRAKVIMTEARFNKIYQAKMGVEFNINNISEDTIGPQLDLSPKWSNKMAHLVDTLREQYLTKQIETRINKYQKVLVVYGSAHLLKQREMLKEAFGNSNDASIHQK